MSDTNLTDVFGDAGFSTHDYEPTRDFEVLPPGDYVVMIESADKHVTKSGDGMYVKVVSCVVDGPHKNRKLYDNINIINQSEKAEAIGRGQLSALAKAAGFSNLRDTSVLIDRGVIACVKVDKNGQNNVRTYKPLNVQTAATPAQLPMMQAAAAPVQPATLAQPPTPMQQPVQPPAAAQPPVPQVQTAPGLPSSIPAGPWQS